LGPRGQAETSINIEDFSWKYKTKIKIKRQWLRLWCPLEIHGFLLACPGRGPMYRLNTSPPLIGPDSCLFTEQTQYKLFTILKGHNSSMPV
jgi:hypothetical protein